MNEILYLVTKFWTHNCWNSLATFTLRLVSDSLLHSNYGLTVNILHHYYDDELVELATTSKESIIVPHSTDEEQDRVLKDCRATVTCKTLLGLITQRVCVVVERGERVGIFMWSVDFVQHHIPTQHITNSWRDLLNVPISTIIAIHHIFPIPQHHTISHNTHEI